MNTANIIEKTCVECRVYSVEAGDYALILADFSQKFAYMLFF